jgi:hypothetical protein
MENFVLTLPGGFISVLNGRVKKEDYSLLQDIGQKSGAGEFYGIRHQGSVSV